MGTNISTSMDVNDTSLLMQGCSRPAPFNLTENNPVLLAHCYILGTIFNLLAVTAVFFLYRLIKLKGRPLVLSVNILLIMLATMRYIYLAVDPYNIRMYFPTWFVLIFEDMAIPCLTSAFAIVQYALFQLCKIQRPNKRMQSPRILWSIVIFHFTFVIVIDIVIIFKVTGCWLAMLCRGLTLAWGLVLSVTIAMVALTLVSRDKRVKRTLRGADTRLENGTNLSTTTSNDVRVEDSVKKKKFTDHLRKLKRICLSASITGFIFFVVSLIDIILIVNPVIDYKVSKVGWLLYQTAHRIIEIAFGFILLYVSWQRSDTPSN